MIRKVSTYRKSTLHECIVIFKRIVTIAGLGRKQFRVGRARVGKVCWMGEGYTQARNKGARTGLRPPKKIFAPLCKNVLSIVENYWTYFKKNWVPLIKLFATPGAPSWLRAWLDVCGAGEDKQIQLVQDCSSYMGGERGQNKSTKLHSGINKQRKRVQRLFHTKEDHALNIYSRIKFVKLFIFTGIHRVKLLILQNNSVFFLYMWCVYDVIEHWTAQL